MPSYILTRIRAQWTEAEQNYPDGFEPAWLGIGYITADAGALLILVSIVLSILGLRRLRRGDGAGLGRAVGVIGILLPRRVRRRHLGDDGQAELAGAARAGQVTDCYLARGGERR